MPAPRASITCSFCQSERCQLKVPLETVLRVLRTNTATGRRTLVRACLRWRALAVRAGTHHRTLFPFPSWPGHPSASLPADTPCPGGMDGVEDSEGGGPGAFLFAQKEKLKRPCPSSSCPEPGPPGNSSARPRVRQPWQQPRGHALQRRLLERRLLMAVSPWVGDVVLPCSPRRPAIHTQGTTLEPLGGPAVGPWGRERMGHSGYLSRSGSAWMGVRFCLCRPA